MATTVTCSRVEQGDGRLVISFADGTGLEFPDVESAKQAIAALDTGWSGRENAQLMLLGWWLARQPDGSNENVVEGKTLTVDFSAPNPVRVS